MGWGNEESEGGLDIDKVIMEIFEVVSPKVVKKRAQRERYLKNKGNACIRKIKRWKKEIDGLGGPVV